MAALLAMLNLLARWMEGPEHMASARAELQSVAGAEAVVLGPSVAAQLSLDAMCLQGVNIAHTGQDLFETEALAGHLIERGEAPRLWIVATAIDPYLSDNGSPGTARRTRRIETYRALQSLGDWRLIDGDWQGAVRAATLPALGYDGWRYRARRAWEREVLGRADRASRTGSEAGRSLTAEQDLADARRWIAERAIETDRIGYRDSRVAERAAASMARLSQRLRREEAQLVVVFMPVSPAMRSSIRSDDAEARRAFIEALRAAGIAVIDDTQADGAIGDLQFFRDATHLNSAGGMTYSRDLRRRLAAQGLLQAADCDPAASQEAAA